MSFDFNTGSNQESDPTADFLARERAAAGALQGDADLFGSSHLGSNSLNAAAQQQAHGGDRDFERSASAFPALDGEDDGFGIPSAAPTGGASGFMDDGGNDLLGGGGASQPVIAARAPVDERDQFERNFPQLEEPEEETRAPASVSRFISSMWRKQYSRNLYL